MMQDNDKLVLVNKQWYASGHNKWDNLIAGIGGWLIAVSLPVMMLFPDYVKGELRWNKLPDLLVRVFKADTGDLLMLIFIAAYLIFLPIYQRKAAKFERLILSKEGVRYTSPFDGVLKQLMPDWSLSWGRVSKMEIVVPGSLVRNPALISLVLTVGGGKRRIFPARWVDPDTYKVPTLKEAVSLFRLRDRGVCDPKKTIMDSAVFRYITANVPIPIDNARLDKITAAESVDKDPHGRIASLIVILLLGYTIIDIMLGPESYVNDPMENLGLYIGVGVIGAFLSGIWMSRSVLSSGTKYGLAVFVGIMVGVAMVPGALRINIAFDKDGVVTHDYRVTTVIDKVVLQPLEPGWPVIDYFAKSRYWEKFGKNDIYPVQVRKGILGFYQFNSAAIISDIREYKSAE